MGDTKHRKPPAPVLRSMLRADFCHLVVIDLSGEAFPISLPGISDSQSDRVTGHVGQLRRVKFELCRGAPASRQT
jgi:hypothetical protein